MEAFQFVMHFVKLNHVNYYNQLRKILQLSSLTVFLVWLFNKAE